MKAIRANASGRPKLPVSAKYRFRPKPKKDSAETQEKFLIVVALF